MVGGLVGEKVKTKEMLPGAAAAGEDKKDPWKSYFLSIQDRYFHGNSEAYGILQKEESFLETPVISYFLGDG